MNTYEKTLRKQLVQEIPLLRAQIQALYKRLDAQFHLHGADVLITFGYEENSLGSYTRASEDEVEHFHFSLLFIGHNVPKPMLPEDIVDLYKHEYAHYMQYNMELPTEVQFSPGIHGSAWKYCCSLIGAAPTPYYRVGESLQKHDYKKVTTNPWTNKHHHVVDTYRREQAYQKEKNRVVKYAVGDEVTHPKFGTGIVEEIKQLEGSVRLYVRFGNDVKAIDQKWLLRTNYQKRTT